MRILNLYAGIGGNRKLWNNVEVVAVEYNKEVAQYYKDHYPNDEVIVDGAKDYLLDMFLYGEVIFLKYFCEDIKSYKWKTFRRDQVVRNCVDPNVGKYILDVCMQEEQWENSKTL